MAEEAGGPPGRVELGYLPTLRPGLICQHRQEPVDGLGVLQVAQQLAAAGAVDVAPGQRDFRLHRRGAPALPGQPHGGPVAAGQRRQPLIRKGQAAAALGVDSNHQLQLLEPFQYLVEPGPPTPINRPRWAGCSQGQSDNRSRARFSTGFSRAGSR